MSNWKHITWKRASQWFQWENLSSVLYHHYAVETTPDRSSKLLNRCLNATAHYPLLFVEANYLILTDECTRTLICDRIKWLFILKSVCGIKRDYQRLAQTNRRPNEILIFCDRDSMTFETKYTRRCWPDYCRWCCGMEMAKWNEKHIKGKHMTLWPHLLVLKSHCI